MKIHLAVDIGSSNVKLVLVSIGAEREIRSQEVGRFITPRTWFAEHLCINTYRIYDEVCACIRRLAQEGIEIRSLGVDSWSSDFGFVSLDGQALGLPVFYRDWRTNGMPEEVEKIISYEELYPLTMQRRMQDSSLCQLLAQKKEMPQTMWQGSRMLFLADLIMFYFTGRVCSEITLASYSQLYSMEKLAWEDKVFDLFGLPRNLQPEVVFAGDTLGRISEKTAAQLGVKPFEVIAPAGHDTSCAVAVVPAKENENWCFISTGTWFLVGIELERPQNLPLCYRFNCSNTGLAFGKTMCKRNVMAMWLLQRCKLNWEQMGIRDSYDAINQKAEMAESFKAMLDIDSLDFYNPDNMPQAITEYLQNTGQALIDMADVGQIAKIVYEAIAMKCAYAVSCMEKIAEKTLDVIYMVGGVSHVDILCQMIASACGKKVLAGVQEASSIGNGLLQAYGCGEIATEQQIRNIVAKNISLKNYMPQDEAAWHEKYQKYCKFCKME